MKYIKTIRPIELRAVLNVNKNNRVEAEIIHKDKIKNHATTLIQKLCSISTIQGEFRFSYTGGISTLQREFDKVLDKRIYRVYTDYRNLKANYHELICHE